MEATRTGSTYEDSASKSHCIPGGVAEIGAATEHWNHGGVGGETTISSSYSPTWSEKKTDGCWRMTVNDDKLNQVVLPIRNCFSSCGFIAGANQHVA